MFGLKIGCCLHFCDFSQKQAVSYYILCDVHSPDEQVCYITFFFAPLCLHPCRCCLRGLASGRLTCRTGAGRTRHPSPTPACSGYLENPATQASVPTWSGRRWLDLKPTHARPPQTAWSVKNLLVRKRQNRKSMNTEHNERKMCLLSLFHFIRQTKRWCNKQALLL